MKALSEQPAQCTTAQEWFHGRREKIAFAHFTEYSCEY